MDTLPIVLAGLKRELPIVEISENASIAFLQMMGDVELCEAVAKHFVQSDDSQCDFIVTPELKSIPLAHEMSRLLEKPYIVVRKSRKSYMISPIYEAARPFTAVDQEAILWLDFNDAERIKGKNIWIVDDVITTGHTLRAVESLIKRAGGYVVRKLVVLKEGNSTNIPKDITWLAEIPVFPGKQAVPEPPLGEFVPPTRFHHRALDLRAKWPVVYTAISKHMFCYRVMITKFVLEQKRVPINPFMNFDFGFFGLIPKDSLLTANNNTVRIADELWMFGPISDGAYAEILIAKDLGHPIKYFTIDKSWKVSELSFPEIEYEDDVIPI